MSFEREKKKKNSGEGFNYSGALGQAAWQARRSSVLKPEHFVLAIGDEEAICLCSVQSSYQGFVCGTT